MALLIGLLSFFLLCEWIFQSTFILQIESFFIESLLRLFPDFLAFVDSRKSSCLRLREMILL